MNDTLILGIAAQAAKIASANATAIEALKGGLKWKGAVVNYAALPSTGNKVGDMWTTLDDGNEYGWGDLNGTKQWILIGPDLSHFVHETWTFVDENNQTVTKEVVVWISGQ